MTLKAIIFGAIGTIAETSDLQRQAFNRAFDKANLDWHWSKSDYRNLLEINGGKNRLSFYADKQDIGLTSDQINTLHQSKTDIYELLLAEQVVSAREGVSELIQEAKLKCIMIGMASTTSPQNIDSIFDNMSDLKRADFDFILSGNDVDTVKPSPEIYSLAIARTRHQPSEIIVIEDTPVSAEAAIKAGLTTVILPGNMVIQQDMSVASSIITPKELSVEKLEALLTRMKSAPKAA
jgi:HAD superfamily hydrolase (TIGR01509 family)